MGNTQHMFCIKEIGDKIEQFVEEKWSQYT